MSYGKNINLVFTTVILNLFCLAINRWRHYIKTDYQKFVISDSDENSSDVSACVSPEKSDVIELYRIRDKDFLSIIDNAVQSLLFLIDVS